MLKRLIGVTRHGVEAPILLAGFGIIGGDIAAHAIFAAAITDEYAAIGNARCAGDGVSTGAVNNRVDAPNFFAGFGIEGNQIAIQAGHINRSVIHGDAAIDDIAARFARPIARHFRVIRPNFFAGFGIDRINHAP